jgi:D-glycero-alpha-D-manno-heptose-7-phosphate kinase
MVEIVDHAWKGLTNNICVTRTPLRVSFVGGGTDIFEYWREYNGEVISAAINKYIYVFVKKHGEIFEEKIRLNYSKIELTNSKEEIENLIVKGCFRYLNFDDKIFVGTVSDLPAESGLGSSSSFAVGLINAISSNAGIIYGPGALALKANTVELDVLKRNMGKQDAYPAAYGGLNRVSFNKEGTVSITPINISESNLEILNHSLCLVYTGKTRDSSSILKKQVNNTSNNNNLESLHFLKSQVRDFQYILEENFSLEAIGSMLNSAWLRKKMLTNNITDDGLDSIYEKIINAGSLGSKLCGAGGGGFFLCVVPKNTMKKFISNLVPYKVLEINVSSSGSQII